MSYSPNHTAIVRFTRYDIGESPENLCFRRVGGSFDELMWGSLGPQSSGMPSAKALRAFISAESTKLQSFDELVWRSLGPQIQRDLYRLICRIRPLFRRS